MGYKMRVLARIKLNWQMLQQKCLNLVMRQQKNMYKKIQGWRQRHWKDATDATFLISSQFSISIPPKNIRKLSGKYHKVF